MSVEVAVVLAVVVWVVVALVVRRVVAWYYQQTPLRQRDVI